MKKKKKMKKKKLCEGLQKFLAMADITPTPDPKPCTYLLLLACPSGLPPSRLQVNFSEEYDREPHPDSALESGIGTTWERRLAAQPALYNATKFRYGGYQVLSDSEALGGPSSVCLHLGLTDYKTFVGTNLCSEWERFLMPVSEDVDRCKHTASPLGNGAIVETSDDCVLVLQRSSNVGEFPGHLVFPGGHSEPEEVGIGGHVCNDSQSDKKKLDSKISLEMFVGITREVVEETGVPDIYLSEPLFIGISRRVVNVRPTAFFYIKCALSSTQVKKYYRMAADGFESTKILAINPTQLLKEADKMPGCHHGGAVLYDIMRKL